MSKTLIVDFELAGDVKDLIANNLDIDCPSSLKGILKESNDNDIVKVTKTIDSPIKITNIEIVTVELLEQKLS